LEKKARYIRDEGVLYIGQNAYKTEGKSRGHEKDRYKRDSYEWERYNEVSLYF